MKGKKLVISRINCLLAAVVTLISIPTLTLAQAPAEEEAITYATPAVWRVSDADSDYFLLGTFHILPPNLHWRTDEIAEAYDNADIVYFEVDADAPDAASKTLNIMMTQGFNAPGTTLSSLLDDHDAQKLREIVGELSLPFAAVDTMRPWNAFLALSVQFIINQGFEPGSGVDSVLLKNAKLSDKEVRFFETLEEQLSLFTGLDPETEKMLLTVTIRDWDEQQAAFDDLYEAWVSGDTEFLDVEMNEVLREQAPIVYDRLIVDRNITWADELEAALRNESGTGLVAVGAAHLVGDEQSVPALLKKRGFDVSRVVIGQPANDNTPQ
ncbi:TraB/GumN family protein [Hyphococcus formosus]|uniref:TraB/GumN family protein n=1 Tax=Hyphococcus formosus TaxID=3143534 RepID=UPI00398AC6FB